MANINSVATIFLSSLCPPFPDYLKFLEPYTNLDLDQNDVNDKQRITNANRCKKLNHIPYSSYHSDPQLY